MIKDNYCGQQAADAEYKRNLQMWKETNFGAQRDEMEKAGLSVGLMYGNGGGSAASGNPKSVGKTTANLGTLHIVTGKQIGRAHV